MGPKWRRNGRKNIDEIHVKFFIVLKEDVVNILDYKSEYNHNNGTVICSM